MLVYQNINKTLIILLMMASNVNKVCSSENVSSKVSGKVKVLLSEYASSLDEHVKKRYSEKIGSIGIDPWLIPKAKLDPECLLPLEAFDLLSYVVLDTSFYTNQQFKAYKSLQAYNQMASGFIKSVEGIIINDKYVILGQVKHSQRMNDPLVKCWVIGEKTGTVCSAHCTCMAGLGECCSHVASILFYLEVTGRVKDQLSCTQVKCNWIIPKFSKDIEYLPIASINFAASRKLKAEMDKKITNIHQNQPSEIKMPNTTKYKPIEEPNKEDLSAFYAALSKCKSKPVALSLINDHSDFFVMKSHKILKIPDLFQEAYLKLSYPELLQKCYETTVNITEEEIKQIEKDTLSQSQGVAFFVHRAGRIGASRSKAACHTDPSLPSQSLIKAICYPQLFQFSSKATSHGCAHEASAIHAYESSMAMKHHNFQIIKCGLLVNAELPFLHATCDFYCFCDCCGQGCGEVKCPYCLEGFNFDAYVTKKVSCLEKDFNGAYVLKRSHAYYYQVQQQLFTTKRSYNDFVVCGFEHDSAHFVHERIYPDEIHWKDQVPKLSIFWRTCILPEILGRWYTSKPKAVEIVSTNSICYCTKDSSSPIITCANDVCPIKEFHTVCILPSAITKIPKKWYCPHCRKFPEFKPGQKKEVKALPKVQTPKDFLVSKETVCICKSKPVVGEKLLKCHNESCENGSYFHLPCLQYKRMPSNSKTTWLCQWCKCKGIQHEKPKPISSADDLSITKITIGQTEKYARSEEVTERDFALIKAEDGWMNDVIVHQAQVFLKKKNPI